VGYGVGVISCALGECLAVGRLGGRGSRECIWY